VSSRDDAALDERGNDFSAVANQANRDSVLLAQGVLEDAQSFVEVVDHDVAVAGAHPALDALRVNLDAEEAGAVHGARRLGAAHAAEPAAGDELAVQSPVKWRSPAAAKVSNALHDAPRADVNPTAGGHLAASSGPAARARGSAPSLTSADEAGVGDEHARRPLWVWKMPTGLPDCTSNVRRSRAPQRAHQAWKHSSCAPPCRAAVDDELFGTLGDFGSRLFISMRRAASWCQPLQESSVPRGA
jgi:hypothetical protein